MQAPDGAVVEGVPEGRPTTKTDGDGNVIDLTKEWNRSERRTNRKRLRTAFSGKGAVAEVGQGQTGAGRATRWAVRCSACTPGGWFDTSLPNKLMAVKFAAFHIEQEHS